jgi:hypothetical protein
MTKSWGAINKIESRIEATSRADCADGYVENIFGGFDRLDLVAKLIEEYSALPQQDREVAFRLAGALFRAGRLEAASEIYGRLAHESNQARLMLATVEHCRGNVIDAGRLVEEYNDLCLKTNMEFMCTSLEKIAVKKSGTY